jgi:hypothetical protein
MPLIRAYHLSPVTRNGESTMPCRSGQRSARRVPQQIELFTRSAPMINGMPAWSGLPMETRAVLTSLLSQLILDHAGQQRVVATEDTHDL